MNGQKKAHSDGAKRGAASRVGLICALWLGCSLVALAATYPGWWTTRSVVSTSANTVTNDYTPATLGQLKWFATQAANELAANASGGAGTGVTAMVSGFSVSNNFGPVLIGQAKNTAKPFHDRLIATGYSTNYPWTASTNDDNDYAPATIGQVKTLFNFNLDTDSDGLPDWWEMSNFGNLSQSGGGDYDGDGATNLQEYQNGSNPGVPDTDGDGFSDGWEIARGLQAGVAASTNSATILQLSVYARLE